MGYRPTVNRITICDYYRRQVDYSLDIDFTSFLTPTTLYDFSLVFTIYFILANFSLL